MITLGTIVLIAPIALPLWHLHSRIPIPIPIITRDKRLKLRIPTHTCMSNLTSHILIPGPHLLMKSKPNTFRSLPQSGNGNPILVAHHFKLHLETTKHPQHQQFKFHFRCRLLWIHRSPMIIPAHSNMTTILCMTTMMMLDADTPLTPMDTTTITTATVTTCVGYSYT